MSYIPKGNREDLRWTKPVTIGELNYVITNIVNDYLNAAPHRGYIGYNEIVGVLECVKMEFYRKSIAPYKDELDIEHGDL